MKFVRMFGSQKDYKFSWPLVELELYFLIIWKTLIHF